MSPGCGCGFGVLASRSACISVRASVAVFILWCQPHSHWRLDSRWLSPCWMWSQSVPCAVHRVPSWRSASHCPPARLRVSSRSCGQLLGSRECLSDCVHRDCAMWAAPVPVMHGSPDHSAGASGIRVRFAPGSVRNGITQRGVVAWLGRACRRGIPCHPPRLGVRVLSSRGCGDGRCRGGVRLEMGA